MFTLIKGTFHVVHYSPDGDSLRFSANQPKYWNKLAGRSVILNTRGHVQLRFEAIDSLETHFRTGGVQTHQPRTLANQATDFTIKAVGITNVQWGQKRGRVTSANDGKPGYILSRTTEKKGGRPVAFVFSGSTSEKDGSDVYLDVTRVKESINYKILKEGHAFPTYYKGLFHDLRDTMTKATVDARQAGKGIWPSDRTNQGLTITNRASIMNENVVMPKLFRRLASYIVINGNVVGFKQWLAEQQEPILILSSSHFTHFDTVIKQQGKKVWLTHSPEDLVFL